MKKEMFGLILLALLVSFVSASYECSDGSQISLDQEEIALGYRESINGIGLGLIESDETPVYNKYSAELITDAKLFSLDNNENETNLDFKSGEKTIVFTNLTNNVARITLGSDSGEIEEGSIVSIGSFIVYLTNAEGEYPEGAASIRGIVGVEQVSLNNGNPFKIVTFNEKKYLLELYSASDANAIVKVQKCESGELVEIADEVEAEVNDSAEDLVNQTTEDSVNQTEEEVNESLVNETFVDLNLTDSVEIAGDSNPNKKWVLTIIILAAVIFVVLIVYIIFRLRKKVK